LIAILIYERNENKGSLDFESRFVVKMFFVIFGYVNVFVVFK